MSCSGIGRADVLPPIRSGIRRALVLGAGFVSSFRSKFSEAVDNQRDDDHYDEQAEHTLPEKIQGIYQILTHDKFSSQNEVLYVDRMAADDCFAATPAKCAAVDKNVSFLDRFCR